MKRIMGFIFIGAFLLLTLIFATGCKTTPLNADEIEAVYEAGRDGDWDRVCDMLTIRPEFARTCFRKHDRDTLLHMAAGDGNIKATKMLLDKGAYVNGRNRFGQTPLHLCSRDGSAEIARILLDAGADANASDKGNDTVLHDACMWGNTEIVRLLLAHGAQVDGFNDILNQTPLHYAARAGSDEIVEMLIAKGADVNAYIDDKSLSTPLKEAQTVSTAHILRKHGAKLTKNENERLYMDLNFLISRSEPPFDEIVLNLAKGTNVNTKDGEASLLHVAAINGNIEVVKLLIKHGADVNAKDEDGFTALDIVGWYHDNVIAEEIRELLKKHGARTNVELEE